MKLSVFVVTYNQEEYIRDCLDGILMQKVDFDFEVIVGEDCSTDNTPMICDEYAARYPFIHVYHHPKNIGLVKNWEFVLNKCTGDYVAMIEGDDFWTNPNKLQLQVDYLDTHCNCQLSFYKPFIFFEENVTVEQKYMDEQIFSHLQLRKYSRREIYEKWSILTSTVMFRNTRETYFFSSKIDIVDTFFFLLLMRTGSADCIDLQGTAYRRTGKNYSVQSSHRNNVKLFNQYRYFVRILKDLQDLSIQKRDAYLRSIIYDSHEMDTWRYRYYYMWLHKRLFFTTFHTTTILSYMIQPLIHKLCNR